MLRSVRVRLWHTSTCAATKRCSVSSQVFGQSFAHWLPGLGVDHARQFQRHHIANERDLLAAVVRQFPDLSPAQLSEFLQVAQAQAERRAARPH